MVKSKNLKSKLVKLQTKQQEFVKFKAYQENILQKDKKKQRISSHKQTNTQNKSKKIPFDKGDSVLLVGEANFSFALSLARLFIPKVTEDEAKMYAEFNLSDEIAKPELDIMATTLDSKEITLEKYSDAIDNLDQLGKLGIECYFGIDGTKLDKTIGKLVKNRKKPFNKVIFNFPHVGLGIKDQTRNIYANQLLISQFMASAKSILQSSISKQAEIQITLKTGDPYDKWDIKKLAKSNGLFCKYSFAFDPSMYPGYAHRRTLGFKEGLSKANNEELADKQGRAFVFGIESGGGGGVDVSAVKKRKRPAKKHDSDSENESD